MRFVSASNHPYTNTNGNPSAKSPLTMITVTNPIERKGWRSGLTVGW